ncbi:MAG: carboxypeptidase regulatory-like domain-containing protein [Candidatus Diapherotrites archaeon]|uniref:Carboxypeptidase regulatory-like domain-containing protein n=1 Tax=Candidatus Iainarchaeum sp. TaxID=3101447 RepID=A0A8T4LFS0_9ARCH|nr:carboxypeptidase regulatory-like domain-containing protein [Candidatus Diapherotrites archaeon]
MNYKFLLTLVLLGVVAASASAALVQVQVVTGSKTPVAGASVTVGTGSSGKTLTTDAKGYTDFVRLAAGTTNEIAVTKTGFKENKIFPAVAAAASEFQPVLYVVNVAAVEAKKTETKVTQATAEEDLISRILKGFIAPFAVFPVGKNVQPNCVLRVNNVERDTFYAGSKNACREYLTNGCKTYAQYLNPGINLLETRWKTNSVVETINSDVCRIE